MRAATIEKYRTLVTEAGYEITESPTSECGLVYLPCGRCGDTGYVHSIVEGGICFACRGGKGHHVATAQVAKRLMAKDRKVKKVEAAREAQAADETARSESMEPRIARLVEAAGIKLDGRFVDFDGYTFAEKLVDQWLRRGELSEKQWVWVEKLAVEAEKPAPPQGKAPEGRVEVEGKVISLKEQEGYTAWSAPTLKMCVVVTEADGSEWRCFGTVPANFEGMPEDGLGEQGLRGLQVRFTATFAPQSDQDFAFFKRPAKASILEA